MLGLALAVQLPGAVPFHPMDTYAYTGAATVKASSLNVRSGAGTGYRAIGRLAAGASIQVLGEQRGTDGKTWYQIRFPVPEVQNRRDMYLLNMCVCLYPIRRIRTLKQN